MKSFLFLFGVLYAAADDVTFSENDPFIRHFRIYKNDGIDPCDDFYRHICPEKIDAKDFILEIDFLVDESKSREIIANLLNNNLDLLRFKDHLKELSAKLSENAPQEEDNSKYTFLASLEERVAMLLFFSSQHTLTVEEHSTIAKDLEEYRNIAVEQVKNSGYLDEVEKELVDTLNYLSVNVGFQGERIAAEDSYKNWPTVKIFREIINRLYQKYGERFKADQTGDELSAELHGLLEWFDLMNQEFVTRVSVTGEQNAFYLPEGNILSIPEANLLLTRNSTPAAKAGSLIFTIGHELYHSLFNHYLAVEGDDEYTKRRICLENHMKNVCQEYQPHCHSGNKTFYEDSADLEGIQGAILWLKKRLGNDYKKPMMDNTTNEQMFFYAYAAGWCTNGVNLEDEHSSPMSRVNGPLSLSSTFREAFQCKDDHKLMKLAAKAPEHCNFFGDALR